MELIAFSYLLLFFILAFGILAIGRIVERMVEETRHGWVRLLVIIPQGLINPLAAHHPHEIFQSAELYKRLGELNVPFTLEVAVHGVGEDIHFYIYTPKMYAKQTSRLINSLWPTSYVTEADEYELWLDGTMESTTHVAAGYLAQAKSYCVPFKSAHKGHFEPFLGVLQHLSGLATVGEGAAIQWVIRKADPRLIGDIADHLAKFQKGEYHPSRHVHENFLLTKESIKLLEEKVSSPLFAVNCRIVTAAIAGNAMPILKDLASHFSAGSATGSQHNEFKLEIPKQPEKLVDAFLTRRFEPAQEMIMSANELATYFHFPGPTTAAPKIKR